MHIRIVEDKPLDSNCFTNGKSCSFGATTRIDESKIFCMYRSGTTKHSYDGKLLGQLSEDNGKNWNRPVVICDLTRADQVESVISGQVAATHEKVLIATVTTVFKPQKETSQKETYLFSNEGKRQKRKQYKIQSSDYGKTWLEPEQIAVEDDMVQPCFLGQSVLMPNGELFFTFGHGSKDNFNHRTIGAYIGSPDGRIVTPLVHLISDSLKRKNYDDPSFAVLPDGTIIAYFWTWETETEKTVSVHRSESKDNGRTWTHPEPVGLLGQIFVPLYIGENNVIAVSNYRTYPEGIRLWISNNNGKTFNEDYYYQMWNPETSSMEAKLITSRENGKDTIGRERERERGVWDSLKTFSFGTPSLLKLDADKVLLTYYATISDVIHMRSCIFSLT